MYLEIVLYKTSAILFKSNVLYILYSTCSHKNPRLSGPEPA